MGLPGTAGLRRPFFLAAVVLATATVLIEVGASTWLPAIMEAWTGAEVRTVGHGIAYLALVDGLVLWTLGLMFVSLIVPERLHGRMQGIATLAASVLVLLAALGLIFAALGHVILMVALLSASPFGTAFYFSRYGDFPTGTAAATLGVILALKLGYAGCLLAAHQRMLENRGLVLLVLTALLATIVVGLLHAVVPGFLVSITDAVAAIVVGVLAMLWSLILLVGSVVPVLKAFRLDRA